MCCNALRYHMCSPPGLRLVTLLAALLAAATAECCRLLARIWRWSVDSIPKTTETQHASPCQFQAATAALKFQAAHNCITPATSCTLAYFLCVRVYILEFSLWKGGQLDSLAVDISPSTQRARHPQLRPVCSVRQAVPYPRHIHILQMSVCPA